jgi:hypothetical protein
MKIDGFTRVTDVLSPFSGIRQVPQDILNNACKRGSAVHDIIEGIQDGIGAVNVNPLYIGYVNSYEFWAEGKEFIEKPPRFFCEELQITGECDCIYKGPEGLILVDFKTPVRESKTWPLQGSAYCYLARRSGYDIKRLEFVKLEKDGKGPKVFVYEEKFDLFLKCLEVYRYFGLAKEDLYIELDFI